MKQPHLQIYTLGRFELFVQSGQQREQLEKPPTQKSQSLLVYLAYHRQRLQPREQLMEMFWGDRPDHRARRSLSTALWHVRRCLASDDPIQGDAHAVRFAFQGTITLDAQTFARQSDPSQGADVAALEATAAAYRGPFLPGFYDDWVIDERYRLQSLYEEVLARLMILAERRGRQETALHAAQRLLQVDVLREDAHRLVMRVYARQGQRNAALEQYRHCRATVLEELGVEPMAETTSLYEAIAGDRFSDTSMAVQMPLTAAPAILPPLAGRDPLDPTLPDILAGREQEMDFLLARWRDAPRAGPVLVLVGGEAGVGKTQLVKRFAARLQQDGIPVLWGRCFEFERQLPFQPIAEALRPLLAGMTPQDLQRLPQWVFAALIGLLPDLVPLPEEADEAHSGKQPPAAQALTGEEQTRLFHAVAHLLRLFVAGRPEENARTLLIALDDLHWASPSTLALLHYLARHLASQPLLLVGAYRGDVVGEKHPLWNWQQSLHRDGLARRLRLKRLPAATVESWLVEMAGAGDAVRPLAQRLHAETEGNPFFVVQMVKALFEMGLLVMDGGAWRGDFERISGEALPLPATIRELIESRAQRLPNEAREALSLAAILGREFDFDILAALYGRGEEETLSALEALLRARLVEEGAGAAERDYVFAHHKIREVVYATIPRRRRQQRHAQAAQTMVALHAQEIDVWLGEVAFHFEQGQKINGELTGIAVHYLRRAGEQAAAQFALSEAVAYFGRALALVATGDTRERIRLLMAREQVHDWQAARDAQARDLAALGQLLATLPPGDSQISRWQVELALREAGYHEARGDYQDGLDAVQRAIALVESSVAPELEAKGRLKWGHLLYRQGAYGDAEAQLARALRLAQEAGLPDVAGSARQALALAYWAQGAYEQAAAYAGEALAIFLHLGNRRNAGVSRLTLGNISQYRSDHEQARAHFEESLRTFREIGDRRHESSALTNLGVVAEGQSDFAAAEAYHTQCLALSREIGDRRLEGLSRYNLGVVSQALGRYAEARGHFEACVIAARETDYRRIEAAALREMGFVAADLGHFSQGMDMLAQALRLCDALGDRRGLGVALTYRSRCLAQMGAFQEAEARGKEGLELLRAIGSRAGENLSLCALGLIAWAQSSFERAYDLGEQALAIAQAMGSPSSEASCLALLGDALAGLGSMAAAQEAYAQAEARWKRTGQAHLVAPVWAGRATLALAQDDVTAALAYVEKLWPTLAVAGDDAQATATLPGVVFPGQVYLACYHVLARRQDDRAHTLLAWAQRMLEARAQAIDDAAYRQSFMEDVAANRALAALWAASG